MTGRIRMLDKPSRFLIIILSSFVFLFCAHYRFAEDEGKNYKRVIDGDGKGYYAYLPAIFIYHDLSFSFFEEQPEKFGFGYAHSFILNHHKKNINKYTCGEALLLLPFFLLACIFSLLLHLPVDGYNPAFQLCCAVGGWFYFSLGLYYARRFLAQYGISFFASALALLALVSGTNLLNYVVKETSMSHVFSFFLISAHVFYVKKYAYSAKRTALLTAVFLLALIVLVRPVNLLVVLAYPFLFAGKSLRFSLKDAGYSALLFFPVLFLQLILWKAESGNFFINSYKNEGFYFNRFPPIAAYLFSFKRGAFIYSPVLLFAIPGFFYFNNKKQGTWLFLFLFSLVYMHASWWSWYYGDGFGERPLIDFYIFFGLLMALTFEALRKKPEWLLLTVFMILILLHQVFFYQYRKGIIHPYSMDFTRFKEVFLKTGSKYQNLFICAPEDFYAPKGIKIIDSLIVPFADTTTASPAHLFIKKENCKKGYYDASEETSLTYEVFTDSSWLYTERFAEVSVDYLQPLADSAASHALLFITESGPHNEGVFINTTAFADKNNNEAGVWQHGFYRLGIGIPEQCGEMIHIFIANAGKRKLYIKNFQLKIVEAKR